MNDVIGVDDNINIRKKLAVPASRMPRWVPHMAILGNIGKPAQDILGLTGGASMLPCTLIIKQLSFATLSLVVCTGHEPAAPEHGGH